jgi:hypothetical protein
VEHVIQTNGGGKSVATTPSVADVVVKGVVGMIQSGFFDYIDGDYFDAFPGIIATADAIANHEGVKAYYASLEK